MNLNKNTIYLFKREVTAIFFVLFLLFFNCDITYSATADELRDQIQKITETKQQLQKEIAVYEDQLKDIGEQTTSLKNTIKLLDATINKNTLDIKLTQNNINSTQLQIEELSINIGKNVNIINENTKTIAKLLNQVNIYDSASFIENLLVYKDLSEFWNEQQNVYLIQNQISDKITETKNTKTALENNKTNAEKKKKDLLDFKSTLIDKKNLLDITKKEKNKLLADTKNSEANYIKMLADKKTLADAFDKELLQFESELKFSIDKNSFPSVGKGILSWPLDIVKITQKFGMTDFAKTGFYGGAAHNGVDFRASIGTPVKASLSGVVKGVGDTDIVCPRASFGKWVFIEHNNGLSSIYAHLSLIKVSEGQVVTTGDVIGYSGNTGNSTGPHLHMSVYASQGVKIMSRKSVVPGCGTYTMPIASLQAYLDPLQYL